LIIFKQIIDFCKERSIKNVIFISEDIKKDWRHIEDQEGDKILGARPELKRELNREAGVENFLIYQIEDFVKKTNEYLDIKIEPKTLKSIKLSLEEDKHQKSFENKVLEAQKMQELYERVADNSAFSKAVLEAQKMQELYGRVADDSAFSKAALEAQKMQKFYSYENFIKKVKDDQDDE